MNRALLRRGGMILVAVTVIWLADRSANAMKPFREQFVAKYVKADSTDAKDKAFAEAVEAAKCGLCHEGKTKAKRNVYGRALNKFLDEDDASNVEKIKTALDKVAEMKCNPSDPKSPTFGELIKAGKLPAGDVKKAAK